MNKPLILLADDEQDVRELVAAHLPPGEFETLEAADGVAALELARGERMPDLLVLDLMLPGMSGLEICRALKADPRTAPLPILMLTARAGEFDRIVGLELGAADYVVKPFSPRELVLRIRNALKNAAAAGSPRGEAAKSGAKGDADAKGDASTLTHGPLTIDRDRMHATLRGKRLDLTATEFRLLLLLLERRGRVQSRDTLLADVWGYETAIETRTVDTHVRRLRDKLGDFAEAVETVRGFGYRIAESL